MEEKPSKTPSQEKPTIAREQLAAKRRKMSFRAYEEIHEKQPPTSYMATMMHLFKGNVGTGCYAMADAMKNGGLILGPILTVVIALICIHSQHMLIKCAEFVKAENQLETRPDYADTVEMSFANSKHEKWRRLGPMLKKVCNIFICVTQLGFCSAYFLFISQNVKNVLDFYDIVIDVRLMVAIVLIPVWMSALIRKLRYIGKLPKLHNFLVLIKFFF